MEMKKLHMGTMSFGYDTMDEVAHQLNTAFGADRELIIMPNITFAYVPNHVQHPMQGTAHYLLASN